MYLSVLLVAAVALDACLADADGGAHGGRRRGGRRRPAAARLRNGRQQQFAAAAQLPLGPPPQPAILLDPGTPLPLQQAAAIPLPPQRQQIGRGGRQFDVGSDSSTFQGSTPDENGNYNFQLATDDGTFRQESGRQKQTPDGEANEVTGEVSWTDEVTGETISFTYVADENGFSAQGSHIPQAPPIPPAIQRGLDLIRRANGIDF